MKFATTRRALTTLFSAGVRCEKMTPARRQSSGVATSIDVGHIRALRRARE